MKTKSVIFVDIDGTICTNRDDMKILQPEFTYEDCHPYHSRIRVINGLFEKGHTIV